MTTSFKVRSILKQAMSTTSGRRAKRLLRGKMAKALRDAKLSDALQDSALREFDRIARRALIKRAGE